MGVRLVETKGKIQGIYACLSYCWGYSKTQIGQTTRDNLSRQLHGIPFYELPGTVIDAIRLCFRLGFRYLWVDRLCIVQDDENDWLLEASKMCEVYSRSALTVATPISVSSSESFLTQRRGGFRDQRLFATITYTGKDPKSNVNVWLGWGSRGAWFLEESLGGLSRIGTTFENCWLERGWTLQEWMLSPRVLHIDSMTLWDCFDGYANELTMRHMEKTHILRNPEEFGAGISWDSIMEEFSTREFSQVGDKLPALAGLAARYAQATGHTYLAGLWQEDLPRSLLWIAGSRLMGRASRSIPSWSWALSVSVRYPPFATADVFTPRASRASVCCQYNTPDSFAAIEKAWIEIDGHVSLVMATVDESRHLVTAADELWDFRRDDRELDLDLEIAQANVYLLLLGEGKDFEELVYGALALLGCGSDDSRLCFRRVGTASMSAGKEESRSAEFGPSWKRQVVRLV